MNKLEKTTIVCVMRWKVFARIERKVENKSHLVNICTYTIYKGKNRI